MTALQQRIKELAERHGSIRAAARVLMVDHAYLYRLSTGEKDDPGDDLLRKLKLRRIVAYQRTDDAMASETPPAPYRCIKPQCPLDCSGCNHAVPGDDEALVLIADLLNELAVDGFGAPCEDGDSKLVDRARAFLRKGNRGVLGTYTDVTAEPKP